MVFMSIFLGRVEIHHYGTMNFYNFVPIYSLENGELEILTEEYLSEFFDGSEKLNMNISYQNESERIFLEGNIYDDTPIILEFNRSDLEKNINPSTNKINPTKYKLLVSKFNKTVKLHSLKEFGIYRLLEENDFKVKNKKHFADNEKIELLDSVINYGFDERIEVMVRLKEESVYSGPYKFDYIGEYNDKVVSKNILKSRDFLEKGYSQNSCTELDFEFNFDMGAFFKYVKVNKGAKMFYRDLITDSELVKLFETSLETNLFGEYRLDLSKLIKEVERIDEVIFRPNLPEGYELERNIISNSRKERIQNKITTLFNREDGILSIISSQPPSSTVSSFNNIEKEKNAESYLGELKKEVTESQKDKEYLGKVNKALQNISDKILESIENKVANMHVEGLIANKLQDSASIFKERQEEEKIRQRIKYYKDLKVEDKSPTELIDYLVETIGSVRNYDKNTIININACIFQNFITVFSGDPGCGKTSICNILGQVYGLTGTSYASDDYARYIPISVERGWTSKRDFIGYYNPLTKTFDNNNKRLFDALQTLNLESRYEFNKLPMLVLLDEANLSPMEYYWADFMNICDDLSISNELNIGGDRTFKIPETLHFTATINNDHTTETLSPRLIDRASIITLPSASDLETRKNRINPWDVENISWKSIRSTFIYTGERIPELGGMASVYNEVKQHLEKQNISLSPRTERAIKEYCHVTSKLFDSDEDPVKRPTNTIALDFAILQKVLPKINGYGEDYRLWLEEFSEICKRSELDKTREAIKKIIKKGSANMEYYQFFA